MVTIYVTLVCTAFHNGILRTLGDLYLFILVFVHHFILGLYIIPSLTVLDKVFSCLCCQECFETGSLYIDEDEETRKGLASFLDILCRCGYKKDCCTSKTVEKAGVNVCNKGIKPLEVNFRAVYGMSTIGGDHTSLEKLWYVKHTQANDC